MKLRVRLIHWNAEEARQRIAALEDAGHEVLFDPLTDQKSMRRIGQGDPQVIAIDLTRLPAQGRDIAIWIRQQKDLRRLPLILLGGVEAKVAKIREILPDVVFATWRDAGTALERAIVEAPAKPVVPESAFAGYSGTPLPKKLGIKEGSVVALVSAPVDFDRTLGPLPAGAQLRPSGRGRRDLTICFVRSARQLERRMASLIRSSEQGNVWIAWPKKASGVQTDLTQSRVRRAGLDAGLVDFKICAIDQVWSGLCFALRRR